MPAYSYAALNAQGRTEQGVVEADSERAARSQLRTQALVPIKVLAVAAPKTRPGDIVLWSVRVFSRTDLVVWTRQLASLVAAGLPLERALTALSEEAATPAQRDLVAQLRAEVNAGAPLAQALAMHPREFDELFVAVMGSGEQSGRLGQVLGQLANDLEAAHTMRSLIHDKASEPLLRDAAQRQGMTSLREDGQRLVSSGVTSMEELVRVTRD